MMMTMFRKTAAALLALGMLGAMGAPPAAALEREGVTLREDDFKKREYPAIVGQNPAGTRQGVDDCKAAVYCDAIPIDVVVAPGTPADANYVIQVRVFWDTPKANGTTVNDVDIFFKTADDEELQKSASQAEPESVNVPRLKSGRYYLVVVNYLGDNHGYRVEFKYLSDSANNPFELLDERNQGPSQTSPPATTKDTPPEDRSAETPFVFSPPPSIAPFEAAPDDSFDPSLFDNSNDRSGGPDVDPTQFAGGRPAGATVPPASGAAVFLSLIVLPLAVVGGGGAYVWRRRASSFVS
jgi:hypothetical protein